MFCDADISTDGCITPGIKFNGNSINVERNKYFKEHVILKFTENRVIKKGYSNDETYWDGLKYN
jgi:hypothetical protein